MKIEKKISIIIPTYNRKNHLKVVLEKIKNQHLDGIYLNTIVVVDGSIDGTIEMLEQDFPEVHLVRGTGNWWFTKSLNEGIKFARSFSPDFILTLNDDCSIGFDFVESILDAYYNINERCIVGAITVVKSKPYRITFSGTKKIIKWNAKQIPYLDNRININISDIHGIHRTFSLMTRGLLIPWNIGEAVGFFDQNFFPQYGSDDDFTLRVINKGYSAYVSWDVRVFDSPKLTSKGAAHTRPSLYSFFKSFFNDYTVNSLKKSIRFKTRHGFKLLLPISIIEFLLGTFYAYLWKYRKLDI